MATYDSLSASDKAVVDNTVNLIRAVAGEMGGIWNHLRAIADDSNAVGLILSVDAACTIPNASGLAGADDMTRAEIEAIYSALAGIQSTHDTSANRAAMSKAAGINALLR